MRGWSAVYYREMLIMGRRFWRMLASMSVSPTLYLLAFGYAMGDRIIVRGHTYTEFLIPGLVAMASMTQAYGIASEINISRFYWHIFEEFQAAPISDLAYVLGEVLAGMTRAMISVIVILTLGFLFKVSLGYYTLWFWLPILLNSFIFASLAVGIAMLVKTHSDQAMVTNFIITPMAFLGGTFFPIERLPMSAQKVLFFLPLTHASKAIRAAAFGQKTDIYDYVLLASIGCLFFFISVHCVNRAKD